jgi:hypothetical protein
MSPQTKCILQPLYNEIVFPESKHFITELHKNAKDEQLFVTVGEHQQTPTLN